MGNSLSKKIFIFCAFFCVGIGTSFANSIDTGIPGVVIKKARCLKLSGVLVFTISNRNKTPVSGVLEITAFDKENDPIGNATEKFSLKGVSGDEYQESINCDESGYFKFQLVR